jgi:hypothetical protein
MLFSHNKFKIGRIFVYLLCDDTDSESVEPEHIGLCRDMTLVNEIRYVGVLYVNVTDMRPYGM